MFSNRITAFHVEDLGYVGCSIRSKYLNLMNLEPTL